MVAEVPQWLAGKERRGPAKELRHSEWNIVAIVANRGFGSECHHAIVLLGIHPERADPELGYIVPGTLADDGTAAVLKFVEKPAVDAAQELLSHGALWNAFIAKFIWGARTAASPERAPGGEPPVLERRPIGLGSGVPGWRTLLWAQGCHPGPSNLTGELSRGRACRFAQVADVLNGLEHDAEGSYVAAESQRAPAEALKLLQASYEAWRQKFRESRGRWRSFATSHAPRVNSTS